MAYNRRKRKVKKNIPEAQAHISSSYNNTLVTITDKEGNTISWASSGTIGYKGSKKKTPYAAGLAAESAGKAAMDAGATDEQLAAARQTLREAQWYWDFVAAESSMGFHNPDKQLRVLGLSIDKAHTAIAQVNAVVKGSL